MELLFWVPFFQYVQYVFQYVLKIYTVNVTVLFHSAGVSGKDGAMQLASKALMKKSTTRSLHYNGNAIIETAPEMDEILQ